jgi:hypothetical protein
MVRRQQVQQQIGQRGVSILRIGFGGAGDECPQPLPPILVGQGKDVIPMLGQGTQNWIRRFRHSGVHRSIVQDIELALSPTGRAQEW